MNPWPRQFVVRVVLVLITLVAALALRAPRRVLEPADVRDSVSDHAMLLSKGHASLACAACHISHPAKAQQPLWQPKAGTNSAVFVSDSQQAGGVKTGLCMSCHDGTVASPVSAHFVSAGGLAEAAGLSMGANHPVGVDYMAAVRRDPMSFNDPASNPRIVLEDGTVGCVSCHAAHDISAMSASSLRHEVCIECHRR